MVYEYHIWIQSVGKLTLITMTRPINGYNGKLRFIQKEIQEPKRKCNLKSINLML